MSFIVPADADVNAAEYETAILGAISSGNYTHTWAPVTNSIPGHTATFQMSADVLKIDGVRWGMGAKIMQEVADMIGALLPTPKLRDLQWVQSEIKLSPVTVEMLNLPLSALSYTSTMRAYSAAIDKALAKAGGLGSGQAAPSGKPWVLTNALASKTGIGCNYGWYVNAAGNNWLGVPIYPAETNLALRVIQQPGYTHGLNQSDYSETPIFVHRRCIVDGVDRDIADVLVDPELAPLASHEGVLKVLRQPGVPIVACAASAKAGAVSTAHSMFAAAATGLCGSPAPVSSSVGGISTSTLVTAGVVGVAAAGLWYASKRGWLKRYL